MIRIPGMPRRLVGKHLMVIKCLQTCPNSELVETILYNKISIKLGKRALKAVGRRQEEKKRENPLDHKISTNPNTHPHRER